ncbi:MAG: hypothetical protein PHD76_01190 [Methylacidiphilales bacterium]|nr:hypothetical protein [Candidatus Methylacidiphilales bacterium]
MSTPVETAIGRIREQMPANGFFKDKTWRISPEAFSFDGKTVETLEKLGPRLLAFLKAANLLYRKSVQGKAPEWIARWLDQGKPEDLIQISRSDALRDKLPGIIRPDLILTEHGFALSEVDSVPGGVGLTAWLNEVYAGLGEAVIGGANRMKEAATRHFPTGSVVISEEALDYRPEFEWLYGADRVKAAESYQFNGEPVYRFFECFDWPNLGALRGSWNEGCRLDPPLKPFLEEKLWLALFWLKPLQEYWRQQLGERYYLDLRALIPQGWVVEPGVLPPTAVLPGLEAQSWQEVADFSQKERELILKISGFSPLAWGSRGVTLGSDVSGPEWREAVEEALQVFARSPYIMQRFAKGRMVEHPYWDEQAGVLKKMQGRVRVCPYYFVEEEHAELKGVLVTLCPSDKKLIHGMQDAVIVPGKSQN